MTSIPPAPPDTAQPPRCGYCHGTDLLTRGTDANTTTVCLACGYMAQEPQLLPLPADHPRPCAFCKRRPGTIRQGEWFAVGQTAWFCAICAELRRLRHVRELKRSSARFSGPSPRGRPPADLQQQIDDIDAKRAELGWGRTQSAIARALGKDTEAFKAQLRRLKARAGYHWRRP